MKTQHAVAFLELTVTRNENAPEFVQGEYRRDLLEYFPLGESILRVSATDQDKHVCLKIIAVHVLFAYAYTYTDSHIYIHAHTHTHT